MTKWWWSVVAGVMGLILGLGLGLWNPFRGPRTAMVDLERVLTESPLAQEYNKKLNDEAKKLSTALEKAPAGEKAAKKEEYQRELLALQQRYRNEVLTAADKVLADLARRRGVEVVYVRGGLVRYAETDFTDEVIRRLK